MHDHIHGYEASPHAYPFPLIIKQLLNRAKTVSLDQEIFYADKARFTYREFLGRIQRFANVLTDLGLKRGDVVAVMDWDSHRYLEAYFAIPMLGLILQTVNIRLSPEKILYTLNHAKPKALLLNSEFMPMIGNHVHDVPSVEKIIWLDDHATPAPDFVVGEYEELLSRADDVFEFKDFDENTIATTFYTSGTTGDPKGVFFSHRQIVLHAMAVAMGASLNPDEVGLRYSDVYMPITPMFHVNGWGIPYVATMIGLKQIYPSRYVPSLLVDLAVKHKVSFTHCVPTILQMMLKEAGERDIAFDGLKMIIGGSRLTEGLAKSALARGIQVYTAYGMSETCPVITVATFDKKEPLTPENSLAIRVSTGVPVPLVDLQIWNEHGQSLPQDGKTAGEVVVRTPWLTQSYFKNQDAGDELWTDGYLHTQDIAHMDDKGVVRVTDRLKDVIKSGGEWVSSLEIETILSLHPSVADIAVIGIPDDKWGERPLALVVKKTNHDDITPDDILALAHQAYEREIIPKYGIPSELRFVADIPKTSVGKHDKKVIRTLVADGEL
ncbi:fatty acid--CoA ligase [Moraxella equi]|uniref:Long-chain-fatty-acid--CoA ligase n=1 Tax=Moraxella equi TaxID=60442 RepID=A0A378QUY4_9GAMM|nr:fatty acid--CoA ligase [Moraxella equi]OPH39949.1 long-chain fatty acid--CoA ligase [Moraxella equi]STZ04200.1 Long-chain-fatty-acid--CoA ligase [Moraxella equi]